MSFINRVFFVDFYQFVLVVVNFLPELYCNLISINYFNIPGIPAVMTRNLKYVPATTIG